MLNFQGAIETASNEIMKRYVQVWPGSTLPDTNISPLKVGGTLKGPKRKANVSQASIFQGRFVGFRECKSHPLLEEMSLFPECVAKGSRL